jgi:hypothetical protein
MNMGSNGKIIDGEDLFFKDDVQIHKSQLEKKLSLPAPTLCQRDELQIIYKGNVFVIAKNPRESLPKTEIKVYTNVYGLQRAKAADGGAETIKSIEDRYFRENQDEISKAVHDMVSKSVTGIPLTLKKDDDSGDTACLVTNQIGSQLVDKINEHYASMKSSLPRNTGGTGVISDSKDGSEFNNYFSGSIGLLVLDRKLYYLETMQEYIAKFQKAFEPSFYKEINSKCAAATPEEVADLLEKNAGKVHPKALPTIKNKIWLSKRSFKLYMDGTYFVPHCAGSVDKLEQEYSMRLEMKAKIDGVKKYL